ncbi:hypothetical protein J1D01_06265 [Seonamhaeicola sp. NFXS20]|uniref:hypothetical protein n=1 Tax=Seonamhaeicola sp. NFXS20 TaxID=2816959 RepID=UPI003B8C7AFA
MKTTNQILSALMVMCLLFSTSTFYAQDNTQKRPEFITATKMYWNKNYDATPAEWRAAEKEYMEKVTSKNEHIVSAGYYTHLFTENSNEILYVQSYPSWESIEKAASRNAELVKEAWPNEDTRKTVLEKLNSAYSSFHSDEIYATMSGAIPMENQMEKDMVLYVRINKGAFPEDGIFEEFESFRKKLTDEVLSKNEFIKAYYPSLHAWGADKRDFVEAVYLESLADLHKMFDKNQELMKEAFTEEEAEAFGKYFEGHGDYLYTAIKL